MAHTYYARLREVPLLAGCWQRHRTLTPCVPCSLGLLPYPGQGAGAQPNGLLQLTVTVRWDTARDRCLWHAGGTAGENDEARQTSLGGRHDRDT
jgi:hypothetical protein